MTFLKLSVFTLEATATPSLSEINNKIVARGEAEGEKKRKSRRPVASSDARASGWIIDRSRNRVLSLPTTQYNPSRRSSRKAGEKKCVNYINHFRLP